MGKAKIHSIWLLVMFLIAPTAWADAEALGAFVSRMHRDCAKEFFVRLHNFPGIPISTRDYIASALCEDDRVFWPYAEARAPELAVKFEEKYRTRENYSPLTLGLIGASDREMDETIYALRSLLYPKSRQILSWTGDRAQVHDWLSRADGGLMGGVIRAEIRGETERQVVDSIKLVQDAMSFTMAHHMDAYVLVVNSARDLRTALPDHGDPVRWIQFEPSACDARLRRY